MSESNRVTRRNLLASGVAAAAVTAAASLAEQDEKEHEHQHGGSHGVPKNESLGLAALDCVKTGEDCMEHCLEAFRAGDTSLADCASLVHELIASCGALQKLAASGSAHLGLFARAAREICASCEEECRKHLHHPPCKACAESCAACIEQCDAVSA